MVVGGVRWPAAWDMVRYLLRTFVRDRAGLDAALAGAKLTVCPHCKRTGMVVGHGLVMGYAEHGNDRVVRGRRLLCSRRHKRSGCGRTFAVMLATVLSGRVVRTETLGCFLRAVLAGVCRKAAWELTTPGLSLRSGYRLWARLCGAQAHIRTTLCNLGPPPALADPRPMAQVLTHLQQLFGDADCALAGFQLATQRDLLG
jgi:hypothetical protein